jgi:hypothetical protein
MQASKKYPRFINNFPCGEDLFEGKSQQKISANICNLIRHEENCKIIGIDGGWGSGKSNLVIQIQNTLSQEGYHFFIYDAWGHQEDLQRRSFLEELTEELTGKELVDKEWKLKLKKLLSKVKETESKRVPKLSIGVIVIALAILITPVFYFLGNKITYGYWGLLVSSIPLLAVAALFRYYFRQEKEGTKKEKLKKSFTKLFLEYQNKVEEETKYEMISEDEPSVRKFRAWMNDISKDLNEKKLIVVFDNMDRLPPKKVQELWSSIHVFFSENSYDNIKVIVPFDREHIKLAFQSDDVDKKHYGDDFINKTFNVVYRVSPPILSDWKSYFIIKWKDAFGEEEALSNSNNVLQIFELLSEEITPRRIIAFINEFVSIKLTVKDTIPNNYIALFILRKDRITEKPVDEIIKPSFLKSLEYLFANDEELPKYLAALFYQVDPEKAIQVVFTDRIKRALNDNAVDDLRKMSSIPEFHYVLENAITDVSNYENAILALNELPEDKIGNKYQAKIIWNCLYKKTAPRLKSKISEFQFILLSKIANQKDYLKSILTEMTSDPEFSSTDYFESINEIENKFSGTLSVFSELKSRQTSIEDFISFIGKAKSEYGKYKIKVDQKALNDYLIGLAIPKLKEVEFIPYLTNEYSFMPFTQKLEELIQTNAPNNDKEVMSILYSRYKEVNKEKPLNVKLDDGNVYTLFNNSTEVDDFYFDLIAMRIAKLEKFNASYVSAFDTILQSTEKGLVEKISNRLEYYLAYGSVLIGLKTFKDKPLFKEVTKRLTANPVGVSKVAISKVISNFQQICEFGEIEPEVLLKRLDPWKDSLAKEVNKDNIKQFTSAFFLGQSVNENFSICKYCLETVNQYLDSLIDEQWKEAFKNLKSYEIEVSLITNYKYSLNAFEAFKEFLKEIAEGTITIPDKSITQVLIGKLEEQGRSLKGTFNTVRDSICFSNNMTVPLFKFLGDWLFKYSDLEKTPSSLRTIFSADVLRDNECLQIMFSNQEKMPVIISAANEEAQDFKEIIKDQLSKEASESFVAFAKLIGVEKDLSEDAEAPMSE